MSQVLHIKLSLGFLSSIFEKENIWEFHQVLLCSGVAWQKLPDYPEQKLLKIKRIMQAWHQLRVLFKFCLGNFA